MTKAPGRVMLSGSEASAWAILSKGSLRMLRCRSAWHVQTD